MKIRYMVEYVIRDRDKKPWYEPVGVWVKGPGPGLDLEIAFLPGNEDAQEEAEWVINRLVENDIKTLQDDFLEYHQATLSPYLGARGAIVETEEFPSVQACVKAVLERIRSQRPA